MEKSTCVVDEIISNNNDKPLLVSFTQQKRLDETTGMQFKLNRQKNKNDKLYLETESTTTTFKSTKDKTNETKYCVGVLDKHTGKLKIYETDLFHMKSQLEIAIEQHVGEDNLIKSFSEKKDALTLSFGSKRKQRVIESRIKHAVKDEDLDIVMKETIDAIEITPNECENDSFQFLTVNWEARMLKDVYNLDEIITEQELTLLNDLAVDFAKTDSNVIETWRNESNYQPFILNRLEKFKGMANCVYLVTKLLYLHYLIKFCELRAAEVRRKDPLSDEIPLIIKQKMMDKYTQTAIGYRNSISRAVTPELRDLLVSHIIGLALTLNNYKLDMEELRSVKYSKIKLNLLCRMIGVTFVGKKLSRILEVKLPLRKFNGIVEKKGRK